jgi:hypothetical protein
MANSTNSSLSSPATRSPSTSTAKDRIRETLSVLTPTHRDSLHLHHATLRHRRHPASIATDLPRKSTTFAQCERGRVRYRNARWLSHKPPAVWECPTLVWALAGQHTRIRAGGRLRRSLRCRIHQRNRRRAPLCDTHRESEQRDDSPPRLVPGMERQQRRRRCWLVRRVSP